MRKDSGSGAPPTLHGARRPAPQPCAGGSVRGYPMSFRTNTNARTAAIFAGLLLLVVWTAMGLRATNADGIAAEVVQPAGKAPKPSCPTPEKKGDATFVAPPSEVCQAFGEVTGIQRVAGGDRNPY